jgi:hypothetical protein
VLCRCAGHVFFSNQAAIAFGSSVNVTLRWTNEIEEASSVNAPH